mgnify:CR=1 FL=1
MLGITGIGTTILAQDRLTDSESVQSLDRLQHIERSLVQAVLIERKNFREKSTLTDRTLITQK